MEKIESLWNNILFFKQSNRKCKNISFPPIYFHNNYNLSHRFLSISHSTHVQAGIQYPHRFRLSIDLYIYIYISLYFIILDDLLPYVTNFIYTSLFAYSFRTHPIPCHFTSLARNEQTRFPLPLPPVHQTSLLRKTPRVTATFHYFGSRNNFGPPNNPINIISGMERDDQTLINVLIERWCRITRQSNATMAAWRDPVGQVLILKTLCVEEKNIYARILLI